MSREIKFRAWNTVGKCMVEDKTVVSKLGFNYARQHPDKYILMQFTGLLDKDGREIYESDVVKYTTAPTPPPNIIGVVEWHEFGLWRIVRRPGEDSGLAFSSFAEQLKVEVIGNIYENPDLLK